MVYYIIVKEIKLHFYRKTHHYSKVNILINRFKNVLNTQFVPVQFQNCIFPQLTIVILFYNHLLLLFTQLKFSLYHTNFSRVFSSNPPKGKIFAVSLDSSYVLQKRKIIFIMPVNFTRIFIFPKKSLRRDLFDLTLYKYFFFLQIILLYATTTYNNIELQ